jgi:hypothetical protein
VQLNTRDQNGGGFRKVAVSTDSGTTFGAFTQDHELLSPTCQGSILAFGSNPTRLLYSGPNHKTSRQDLRVFASYDDGANWIQSKLVVSGALSGGYSDLALNANGGLALLHERPGSDIYISNFNLEWLESVVLSSNFDDLTDWTVAGSGTQTISPAGFVRLTNSGGTPTSLRQSPVIGTSYTIDFNARVDVYPTTTNIPLGVKVQDGTRRLMFGRRSDGIYAITAESNGAWSLVYSVVSPNSTENLTYRIIVNNGVAQLFIKGTGEWNWRRTGTSPPTPARISSVYSAKVPADRLASRTLTGSRSIELYSARAPPRSGSCASVGGSHRWEAQVIHATTPP